VLLYERVGRIGERLDPFSQVEAPMRWALYELFTLSQHTNPQNRPMRREICRRDHR